MQKIIRVIDLEIGSERDAVSPGICEYGHYDVVSTQSDMLGAPYGWIVSDNHFTSLINPVKPIEAQYSAIHNIIDEDVALAPEWYTIAPVVMDTGTAGGEIVAFAAHNKKMEQNLIDDRVTGGHAWICTYKLALRLWPQSASHSNNALRYHLRPDGLDRTKAVPTHRALPDAYVTAFLLQEALNSGHSVEDLIRWTDEPSLLPRCRLSEKYRTLDGRGTPWPEVETGFLEWVLTKDFDEDVVHTVQFHLKLRNIAARLAREEAELNRQFKANGMAPSAVSKPGQHAQEETPAGAGNMELPL